MSSESTPGIIPAIGAGGSMRPAFKNGDVMFFEKIPAAKINCGDVVMYYAGECKCAHRVWWKTKTVFYIAGDAGSARPIAVESDRILGRLTDPRPWSHGMTGLVYGVISHFIFRSFRPIKRFFYPA